MNVRALFLATGLFLNVANVKVTCVLVMHNGFQQIDYAHSDSLWEFTSVKFSIDNLALVLNRCDNFPHIVDCVVILFHVDFAFVSNKLNQNQEEHINLLFILFVDNVILVVVKHFWLLLIKRFRRIHYHHV